jgi:molybdenum cofactor cytidylyltransferase
MTPMALVVLAAGASTRLGTCKALADLQGQRAIERLLASAEALGDARPLVVTGPDHDAIAAALEGRALDLVLNRDWSAGRTGSLALAVRARPDKDLCVAPVDHPLVQAGTFAALATAWRDLGAPARGWLAPRHSGQHGHPVLLGRALAAEVEGLGPDTSLRGLRGRAEPLAETPVDDPGVLLGLDTPADLRDLREALGDPPTDRTP